MRTTDAALQAAEPEDTLSLERWAGTRAARRVAAASVIVLTSIVYLVALDGPFLLDDFTNVLPSRPNGNDWRSVVGVMLGNESGALGRPIPTLSFALQFLAGADGPMPFKTFNLCVHLLNAVLFALLLDRLLVATDGVARATALAASDRMRTVSILAGVAVFTLHPLQVSTVMYVVQRMALMSLTFGLAAVLLYVVARQRHGGAAGRAVASAGVVLLTVLSMLCKETGALVPAYIVLIELVVFRASWAAGRTVRDGENLGLSDSTLRLLLIACTVIPLLVAAVALRSGWLDPLMNGYDSKRFTLAQRLASQPIVLLDYLRMIAWPDPALMTFHHDDIDVRTYSVARVVAASLAIVAMLGTMIAAVGRMPLVSLGIGLYLASHLLESTIFPLEPMFEHRNYVGLAGMGILCAGLLGKTSKFLPAIVSVLAMTVVLSSLTSQRNRLWSDDLTIESHAVEAAPTSLRARSGYAISLSRRGALHAALTQLDAAAVLAPADPYFPLERLQTLALVGQATSDDLDRAARVLESGEPSLPTEAVLRDLRRNLEAGRLSGLDATSLSDLYSIAERRYGDFAAASSYARIIAAAAEAHLLAGRNERALASIDRSAALAPTRHRIAVRRLELRAGLARGSVEIADVDRLVIDVPATEIALLERLAAVRLHVAR